MHKLNFCKGYNDLSQALVEALTKKHVKLQIAIETGERWVKFDNDNITQSWISNCCDCKWRDSNTWNNSNRNILIIKYWKTHLF